MTYGHLWADCLYTGISSGPNARCRVWEAFTFFYETDKIETTTYNSKQQTRQSARANFAPALLYNMVLSPGE